MKQWKIERSGEHPSMYIYAEYYTLNDSFLELKDKGHAVVLGLPVSEVKSIMVVVEK